MGESLQLEIKKKKTYKFIKVFSVVMILACAWFQLQLSTVYSSTTEILSINMHYALLNIFTNFVLLSIIWIFVNSLWLSCMIFSAFIFLVSVVNHFTIQLHSSPLTISELGNLKTAFNVIGGYELKLKEIIPLFLFFLLECALCFLLKRMKENNSRSLKKIMIRDICLVICSFVILYFGYFSPHSWMPELSYWSWITVYQEYGYIPCVIKSAYLSSDFPQKPRGYYDGCVDDIVIEKEKQADTKTPDIILILNESFYDLSLLTDIKTDVPYMKNICSMKNAIRGYAVNPSGGTNPSEYELLTSNSMKLLHEQVPFNILDMNGANSIVTHLKQTGYYTIGAHCASPVNYNRGMAYAAMGFDEIHFDDDFEDKTFFGNRRFASDECLYENLLSWLTLNQRNGMPLFAYLLTIQNHGGWDSNEREMDTVHAENDFGECDEEVDEYLSCIQLSDKAFKTFTDQLKKIDRDIIVCMVGDHGPSFINKIVDNNLDSDLSWLLRTSVPFVIWANYDIEDRSGIDGQTISMNYLVPSLLDIAQVDQSPYYEYMLNLKKDVPILTPFVVYFDKYGDAYAYDSNSDYTEGVNNYLYLEYDNLQNNNER